MTHYDPNNQRLSQILTLVATGLTLWVVGIAALAILG